MEAPSAVPRAPSCEVVVSFNRVKRSFVCLWLVFVPAVVSAQETTTSISQHGITWTFDRAVQYGQFVNGDYWVVGPVRVVSVSPAPRTAPAGEVTDLGTNSWGDTGLRNNRDRRNGSMVVMSPGSAQGYDSRGATYNASSSIAFPYDLAVNRSLISSISNVTVPGQQMHHAIMWTSEKNGPQVMRTAAVLTSLAAAPPADAFRPAYAGGTKRIHRLGSVRWDRLRTLPLSSGVPSWDQYERYFERPWLDHMNGAWQGQWLLPIQNQPSYGREIARIASTASLMLQLDVPVERKRKLLIGLVQYGIDLRGIVELGGHWNQGGGHTSGRKWPILFAGSMLGDPSFAQMPAAAVFHEDAQTYYGDGWAGMTALWQMVIHHGVRLPYMHVHPSQWPTHDGGWAPTSESYRKCCTVRAWSGQALAALLMGAKSTWDHNAFFDNVDDWMRQEDLYVAGRNGIVRPSEERSSFDAFVNAMWAAHRSAVPMQPDGASSRAWNASTGKWVSNPRPTTARPPNPPRDLRFH